MQKTIIEFQKFSVSCPDDMVEEVKGLLGESPGFDEAMRKLANSYEGKYRVAMTLVTPVTPVDSANQQKEGEQWEI